MLGFTPVGPKFTRPACRAAAAAAAIDRHLLRAGARPQQQTHRTDAAAAVDRWDRRTDGRTLDRFVTPTAPCADRVDIERDR